MKKYEDQPDIPERLSAYMDDELPHREGAALVDRMLADETLRRQWADFHLIGDTLRGTPCSPQTAVGDPDSLSARVAREIDREAAEERKSDEVEGRRSSLPGTDTLASPIPVYRSRSPAHSSASSAPAPAATPSTPSTLEPEDRSPASDPLGSPSPFRPRSIAGPALAASIAIVAILGIEMIPSSAKKTRYEDLSGASKAYPATTQEATIESEAALAPMEPVSSDPSLADVSRAAVHNNSYRVNLYLLRRGGYQGSEMRAMLGYSRIVGEQTTAGH